MDSANLLVSYAGLPYCNDGYIHEFMQIITPLTNDWTKIDCQKITRQDVVLILCAALLIICFI